MMDKDDPRNEIVLVRYTFLTNRIRRICDLAFSISDELPWYLQITKKLTISTTARTGINGDAIEELAEKLIELQSTIEKIRNHSKQITRNIHAAKLN